MVDDKQPLFPSGLRAQYERIGIEVSLLWWKFKVYKQMYYKQESFDLLEKVAPAFFGLQQQELIDDVILTIVKLLDPPETGKGTKQNLSLKTMLGRFSDPQYAELESILKPLKSKLNGLTANLRTWRDKRIAHNELKTALKMSQLPPIKHKQIRECIELLIRIMRAIDQYFLLGDGPYEDVYFTGDGETILKLVKDAKKYKEAVQKVRLKK